MRPGMVLGVVVALLAVGVIAVGFSGGDGPKDGQPPAAGATAVSGDGASKDAKNSEANTDSKAGEKQDGKQEAVGPVQQQAAPAAGGGGSNFWMWYGISRMAGDMIDGFRGRQDHNSSSYQQRPYQGDARYAPPPPAANDNRAEQRSRFGSSYSKTPPPAANESVGRSRFNSNYGKRSSGGGFRMRGRR